MKKIAFLLLFLISFTSSADDCLRYCNDAVSKPCGDTCIPLNYECKKAQGNACPLSAKPDPIKEAYDKGYKEGHQKGYQIARTECMNDPFECGIDFDFWLDEMSMMMESDDAPAHQNE